MMMLFDTLRELDRLGSAVVATAGTGWADAPIDVSRERDRYVVDADLPGVDPQSIEVSVDGRWLTIRADRSATAETTRGEWLVRERTDASVVRRVTLGQDVDPDGTEATYHDGVLTVTVPIAAAARPRRVPVLTGTPAERPALGAGPTRDDARQEATAGKAEAAHSLAR